MEGKGINMSKIVQIAELSVYGEEDEVLLENLSFTVDRGKIAQVAGLTELQYSTLFDVLTGELTPDSGQVVLDDRNIVRLSREKRKMMLREEVSFLPRDFVLPEKKTVLGALKFKLEITGKPPDFQERLENTLRLTGLSGDKDINPGEGSEVLRAKTGLALSIVNNPNLLVCHKPFVGLNSKETESIIEILEEIKSQKDISSLLLTGEIPNNPEGVEVIESNLDSRVIS